MLHITLSPKTPAPPDDPFGRTHFGFDPALTHAELCENNRGWWVLGERADKQHYMLFSHGDMVVGAMEIEGLVEVPERPTRRAVEGKPLHEGHPVYDEYVGKETPQRARRARNPVTYLDDDMRCCECGCGAPVGPRDYLPGHDLRAVQDRVGRVGSVKQFLRWFDATFSDADAAPSRVQPDQGDVCGR